MIYKYPKNVTKDYVQHSFLSECWYKLDSCDSALNRRAGRINKKIDIYIKVSPLNKKILYLNDTFREYGEDDE